MPAQNFLNVLILKNKNEKIIVNQIKPRKALIIAVDGVAPRAKMNQQRSRRFRSSKETEEELEKAKKAGKEISKESLFDSNCITPGTEFMEKLNEHFEYFVRKKVLEKQFIFPGKLGIFTNFFLYFFFCFFKINI